MFIHLNKLLKMRNNYGIIKPQDKGVDFMPQIIPIRDLKNTSEISAMCHSSNEAVFAPWPPLPCHLISIKSSVIFNLLLRNFIIFIFAY